MTDFEGRGDNRRLRSAMSFTVSACVHGSVLAWVAFSGPAAPHKPALSLYDQEIRPFEKKIVWYRFSEKLPDVSPSVASADGRPLRARVRADQTMVAAEKDDPTPGPMVWAPEPPPVPKPEPPKIELPNVIAVAPAKVLKPFVTPPDLIKQETPSNLPDAPDVQSKVDAPPLVMEVRSTRPRKKFEPPREIARTEPDPKLPDAPELHAKNLEVAPLPVETKGAKPAPRAFVPPPEVRLARQAGLLLPEAPELHATVVEPNALPFAPGARPRPRDFVPPASRTRKDAPVFLDSPPEAGVRTIVVKETALPRGFVPPPSRPMDRTAPAIGTEAPAVNAVPTPGAETTLAIVGLNPAKTREMPSPPASRPSGFSAGPEARTDGSSSTNNGMTLLNVPGLTVRNGSKSTEPTMLGAPFSPTSRENLMAAARLPGASPTITRTPEETIPKPVEAPDPRLSGRVIYTIAIQMPNVTSYSGSWQVWFAEREPIPGLKVDMRAPVPLKKVDPKYVASAAADRVEGIIRLAAMIRRDGHVEQIKLLHHLDDRLDRTAEEALAKWEFAPAARNGVPVDVDAVFEIPFHLAPRPTR